VLLRNEVLRRILIRNIQKD